MDGTCGTHGRYKKFVESFHLKISGGRYDIEYVRINERMILMSLGETVAEV
jgi:hypothetical protein